MSEECEVRCKVCRNRCRLVMTNVVTLDPMNRVEVYNMWQCEKCNSAFREFAGHRMIVGNHFADS